ncbi:Protein of unknown function [Bacillus cereus]|nr:Protein of unknown function [Bacillus cereus]
MNVCTKCGRSLKIESYNVELIKSRE